MSWPAPVDRLVAALARLPGVGRRSAERMAVALARNRGRLLGDLQAVLKEVELSVAACSECGSLTLREEDPCRLCRDPRRDDSILCIVEDPADVELIERSGAYQGRYWSLGARLSPGRGEGPAALRIGALAERVRRGVKEVILALDADVESDATSALLREALASLPVRVTRPARGIPAGSGLAYADSGTLASALQGRQPVGEGRPQRDA